MKKVCILLLIVSATISFILSFLTVMEDCGNIAFALLAATLYTPLIVAIIAIASVIFVGVLQCLFD